MPYALCPMPTDTLRFGAWNLAQGIEHGAGSHFIFGSDLRVRSSGPFFVQTLYSFLVFESASLAFTQIIAMPPYRRSNIPLKVFLELPKPPIKTMQVVPPFIPPLRV